MDKTGREADYGGLVSEAIKGIVLCALERKDDRQPPI